VASWVIHEGHEQLELEITMFSLEQKRTLVVKEKKILGLVFYFNFKLI